MIHFSCPRCRAVLNTPPDKAGHKGHCPKCGQRLQVPGALMVPATLPSKTVLGEPVRMPDRINPEPPRTSTPAPVLRLQEVEEPSAKPSRRGMPLITALAITAACVSLLTAVAFLVRSADKWLPSRAGSSAEIRELAQHPWWKGNVTEQDVARLVGQLTVMNQDDMLYVDDHGRSELHPRGSTHEIVTHGYHGVILAPEHLGPRHFYVHLEREYYHERLTREHAISLLRVELDSADFKDGRR